MNRDETISVIIPTYNSAEFLPESIESVLKQAITPHEIIVVDDGSTDNTEKILEQFENKIIYIKQEKCGPANARNRGIKNAKGNFITFIDADDVWAAEKLSFHLNQFRKFKKLEISIGLTYNEVFKTVSDIDMEVAKQNISLHLVVGATMIKKSVFQDIGFFDEEFLLREDTDWFLRARELNKTFAIGKKLVLFYRKHGKNISNDLKKSRFYLFKLFKKAKDRKTSSGKSLENVLKRPENKEELINMWHNAS